MIPISETQEQIFLSQLQERELQEKDLDNKILPCPFCGSSGIIDKGGFGEIFVACSNNNCGGRLGSGIWFTDETKAIEVWNKREWSRILTSEEIRDSLII